MAKRVQPFDPRNPVPRESEPTLHLGDEARNLFDSVAEEHAGVYSTSIEFWSFDEAGSLRDPLYDEAIQRIFRGPWKLQGWVEMPGSTPEVRQEGFKNSFNPSMWIPRVEFEKANCPVVSEGDVVRVWNHPYFNSAGIDDVREPGSGYFFDVVDVDEDGHLYDNPHFVGFSFRTTRRTEYTPERRLRTK